MKKLIYFYEFIKTSNIKIVRYYLANLLRIILYKFFYKINLKLVKVIDEKILLNFLYNLRPYKTNHELIRLGESGDGGYIIPNDLIGVNACISGGVGPMIGFEHDLAKKGIDCYMTDYSVEKPPIFHEKFYFLKKFIGTENNEIYIKFDDYFSKIQKNSQDFILKIDIEGDEYKILPSIKSGDLKKMRIILIEFHGFSNVITSFGYNLIKSIFDKLQENHTIVHINPNNVLPSIKFSKKLELYDLLEITFLRNDRITEKKENLLFYCYIILFYCLEYG
jgi:hypothetical protein